MAKNEAKIKFTAETSEFNSQIKTANTTMSQLRAEAKLNETQMKATGTTVEGLETKHKLLQQQLATSQTKTEALSQKVEAAKKIYGENSAEVQKLQTQLTTAQTAEEKIKQEITACNEELKKQKTAAAASETATGQLTAKISAQETELESLKGEYTEAVLKFGKASTEAKTLEGSIDTLSSELKENKAKLSDAKGEADKLDHSFEEVKKSSDDASEGFTIMKGVAADLISAGLQKVGDAAGKIVDAFNEVDEGADNVIKATGATGTQADALGDSFNKVAGSVVGDFSSIGSTLGEVNTRFGYTGAELEKCTEDFMKFSEITGVDGTTAVQSVTRAMNDAGIPLGEYNTMLDQLAKAGQSAGIDVTTLADGLSKNGATMRAMGLDTSETIAMLAQFELAGADSSVMLTGMKKAFQTWSESGKDGSKEFSKLIEGVKNGSVTASDAMDIFGKKAGPQLVDAIKSGKFEYNDMLKVIQGSKGTTDATFDELIDGGYKADLAMQNAKLAMAQVGETLLTVAAPAIDAATVAIKAMADAFAGAVQWAGEHKGVMIAIATTIGIVTTAILAYNAVQAIKAAMEAANVTTVWALVSAHIAQAAAAMAAVAPYILIVAAIAAVIAIIVLCVKHWDTIVAAVKNCIANISAAWNTFKTWLDTNIIQPVLNWFKNLWSGIKQVFANVGSWFSEKFQTAKNGILNAWNNVKTWFSNLWSGIKQVFASIGTWFKDKFTTAKNGIFNAWSNVKEKFSGIKNSIVNAFSNIKEKISQPFEKARDAVKTVVDKIKGFFSGLKLSLPKIKMPHFSIKGELSLNPPSVPKLAIEWYKDGGIMTKPTIFGMNGSTLLAGGEAGPEAILPIDRLEGYVANAVERTLRASNMNSLVSAIEDLADRAIELNINGRNIATATASDADSVNGLRTSFRNRGLALE